ncbi:unnamed protein product [Ilex paraguariensis]|uniref:Uncharacterized protein n=1 Tax=Ilex paraguariensis TaxID=185542 RepID=A0ABC8UJY1_9AQUA
MCLPRRKEDLSTDDEKFELKDDASNCCNNLSSEETLSYAKIPCKYEFGIDETK